MSKPLILLLMLALHQLVFAQNWTNTKNICEKIGIFQSELDKVQNGSNRQNVLFPFNFLLFLKEIGEAPIRFNAIIIFDNNYKPVIIQYSSAEGKIQSIKAFGIQNYHPQLANKYPSIKSYKGISLNDPGKINHFNYSNFGLPAVIINSEKSCLFVNQNKIKNEFFNAVSNNQKMINNNDRIKKPFLSIDDNLKNIGNKKLSKVIKNSQEEDFLAGFANPAGNELDIMFFQKKSGGPLFKVHDFIGRSLYYKTLLRKNLIRSQCLTV